MDLDLEFQNLENDPFEPSMALVDQLLSDPARRHKLFTLTFAGPAGQAGI